MSRFTLRTPANPRARRGFRLFDTLVAGLILAGLLAVAVYLVESERRSLTGAAVAIDGDSLRMAGVDIRIEGIDAPELQQTCKAGGETYRCGDAARRELARLVDAETVACRIAGRDRWGRSVARCDAAGADLGASLVRGGFAVAYGRSYLDEEAAARRQRSGLWAGEFQPPEEWRKEHRPQE
jgi:endonuclease YncB( thermonuclease family)